MVLEGGNYDPILESNLRTDEPWRTISGRGRTLADAFANLERSSKIERVVRHAKRDLAAARVALTPEEGEGYWELSRIRDDIYVVATNFRCKRPRSELVLGEGLIHFSFKISGETIIAVSRTKTSLSFARPSLLVWVHSPEIDIDEWIVPNTQQQMISIGVRPEFLIEHCLTPSLGMSSPLRELMSSSSADRGYFQLPLTADMFSVASKLIKNPLKEELALLYMEALTLELLCAAVSSACSLTAMPSEEYSERTLRCLETARILLTRQFAPAPTIRQLARSVGIADTALTRGFKAVYRETVFDFSLRCRMQHALKLLRDEHWSVDRVSEAVGYRHPTSFTTAFRRHYGVRPIQVRLGVSSSGRQPLDP